MAQRITKAQAKKRILEADAKFRRIYSNTHFLSINTMNDLQKVIRKALKEVESF